MRRWRGEGAMRDVLKFIWCFLFHRKYRKRTGERTILTVSITYTVICSKCGNEDWEKEWFLPLG